ncbi:MAG: VOC family protein [Oscillospiraceae bacterium]|jgi:lactoylglutathione lyase|nr:VOC family protein [Oscillospiraceae bacterium]
MHIEHIALWVSDLEASAAFYERFFAGKPSALYHNPKTGFCSRFIAFDAGARLELMIRPDKTGTAAQDTLGYAHIALSVGSREAVDRLTDALREAGVSVQSAPRVTGDGYYESVVLDPDGNAIEITV